MTDIALQWFGTDDVVPPQIDLVMTGSDLQTDEGLRTAVIVSLFTDRRAEPDDVLPDGSSDRRGWWGDAWPVNERDRIGSRLWLLHREKQLQSVVVRAREYAEEALQWLVDDGIADRVTVQAEVVRQGVLGLHVAISRPDGSAIEYRFSDLWGHV